MIFGLKTLEQHIRRQFRSAWRHRSGRTLKPT
jgi:hypothetical protein